MNVIFKIENGEIIPLMAMDLNLGQQSDLEEHVWNCLDEELSYDAEEDIELLEGLILCMDDCGTSVMKELDDNSDFCSSVVFYDAKVYKLMSLEFVMNEIRKEKK